MNPRVSVVRLVVLSLCLIVFVLAGTASAQSDTYVGVTGFADVRRFGSTQNVPFYVDDFSLDATGTGGGVRIGTFVHPRWSLELAADLGTKTTSEYESPIRILIFPPPPPLRLKASTSIVTVATMIGFHPPAIGRVRLGYRAGFSFLTATYTSDLPSYVLPTGAFTWSSQLPVEFRRELAGVGFTTVPPPFSTGTAKQTHNTGALSLGFEAAVDLTDRLSVVPDLRALAFSAPTSGSSVFLIRPGAGLRWSF
jgi:hypothetical protein